MMRLITSVGVPVLCAAAVSVLSAQSAAPPANNEPHHKRLLYTNDVRMFDVTIPPGEATADHVHEYDMATLIIGDRTREAASSLPNTPAPRRHTAFRTLARPSITRSRSRTCAMTGNGSRRCR